MRRANPFIPNSWGCPRGACTDYSKSRVSHLQFVCTIARQFMPNNQTLFYDWVTARVHRLTSYLRKFVPRSSYYARKRVSPLSVTAKWESPIGLRLNLGPAKISFTCCEFKITLSTTRWSRDDRHTSRYLCPHVWRPVLMTQTGKNCRPNTKHYILISKTSVEIRYSHGGYHMKNI
jgi:hypothetical protein